MTDAQIARAVQHAGEPKVSLIVVLNQDNTMELSGPLHNKPLCYQMLLRAIVSIAQHQDVEQPRIAVPGLVVPTTTLRPS